MNRQIVLVARPEGLPKPSDFRLIEQPVAEPAEGFLVFDFASRFHEGQQQMGRWIRDDKLKYQETIVDGLEHAVEAFIGLFHGENIGKQLVQVSV
jgi:NADPH-dependent curcumin reductase CurA